MNEKVIEVNDLDVSLRGEKVIRNASFHILRGDFVGVVGPNGGGKTTLIKTILGILPKEAGSIKVLGKSVEQFSDWRKVAYVSQDAVNFDHSFPLSVRELVSLGRIHRGNLGRPLLSNDWRRVDETLDVMGIQELADRRIGELSGGQKQRVFVAKAMVREPEILFLDEPVAGIDPETEERFYMKLSNLNEKFGVTIVDVSHDLSAVFCRMSKVICVNRDVYATDIGDESQFADSLKKAYGEHFQLVFHEHVCEGVFKDA
jgi:zinc transport system ATP-binding protein